MDEQRPSEAQSSRLACRLDDRAVGRTEKAREQSPERLEDQRTIHPKSDLLAPSSPQIASLDQPDGWKGSTEGACDRSIVVRIRIAMQEGNDGLPKVVMVQKYKNAKFSTGNLPQDNSKERHA